MQQKSMNGADWLRLVLLSLVWGGSFFFVEIVVTDLPPLTIVALRVGGAVPFLWMMVLAGRVPIPRSASIWVAFLAMGTVNNAIPFLLITWGQTHIASGLAAILNATTPLFTVVVAGLFLPDERFTARKLAGVVIGLGGVVLMVGPEVLHGVTGAFYGQLAILGAAISYSFAGVFGRRFARLGVDPVMAATGQVSGSSMMLLPLALVLEGGAVILHAPEEVWLAMAGLAILSTALAYRLYFRILATAGATNLVLVTFLVPVSAILLGSLVLGETLEPVHFAGMAIIALGLSLIDGRLWRSFLRPRAV